MSVSLLKPGQGWELVSQYWRPYNLNLAKICLSNESSGTGVHRQAVCPRQYAEAYGSH